MSVLGIGISEKMLIANLASTLCRVEDYHRCLFHSGLYWRKIIVLNAKINYANEIKREMLCYRSFEFFSKEIRSFSGIRSADQANSKIVGTRLK